MDEDKKEEDKKEEDEKEEDKKEEDKKEEDKKEEDLGSQESLGKIVRRRSTKIRWEDEQPSSTGSESEEEKEIVLPRASRQSVGSGMSLTRADSTMQSMVSLPDDKIDMLAATSLLQQQATEIRKQSVHWESYLLSKLISENDYNFLLIFDCGDHGDVQTRRTLLRNNSNLVAMTFLKLLENLSKDETIQYILIMIDDMLQEDRKHVEIFHDYCAGKKESVWEHFLHLLNRTDEFIVHMSSRIIAKIASWSQELMNETDLQFYLAWLRDQLRKDGNEYMQSVIRCLQMMLRIDEYKLPFVSVDGIKVIIEVLETRPNYQIQYQLIFCLWALTFTPQLVEKLHELNVVPVLANVLNDSIKEKVTRIILAVFRNLIETPEDSQVSKENCIALVQCKMLKQLSLLQQRNFDDEDIVDDIEFLTEKLRAEVQERSSFEKYTAEVKSGHLEWSPVHKSAIFWRENAVRLNEQDNALLRMLIQLLETSKDPLVLSVACFDIGEYVTYYPNGKHVIEELGGKQLIMQLLAHDDQNVRYEALLAVQKLMVHSFEYLEKQAEKENIEDSKSAASDGTSSMSVQT